MKVKTAVIFASGYGTRMLPITAAVQKELLPILNRPVIDYVVADCLRAGVERIIFTIREGSHSLQDYYSGNPALEAELKSRGKSEALQSLKLIHSQAKFEYIEQPSTGKYGTAVPLQVAAKLLEPDTAFITCGGDDFLYRTDGGSDLADLVNAFEASSADGAILTIERPTEELSKYGVLDIDSNTKPARLKRIVEKPELGSEPSNLINLSKYVLTTKLLDYVLKVKANERTGEYYITDAVEEAASDHKIIVTRAKGEYLDAGSMQSWYRANQRVGEHA
jgi:UTP--glucose-1-phosphate uridylyltransferase